MFSRRGSILPELLPNQRDPPYPNFEPKLGHTDSGDLSQVMLIRFLGQPFRLVVLKASFLPKDETSVPLCLEMFGIGPTFCGLVSLLILFFFFLLNGSLITKYHNNDKKLPRGHLGRNCIISDHFREGRLVGGGNRGLNSLERCPVCSQMSYTKLFAFPVF